MKYFTLYEVVKKGMLKRFDGKPYSEIQARRFLVIGKDTPNPLYFPDAQKLDSLYGPRWQFSEEDINRFNKKV